MQDVSAPLRAAAFEGMENLAWPGFLRVVGAKADIGAHERRLLDDEIFFGGFD